MKRVIRRCALYTRKSSEEGLDQSFNSLDAQREACAAYVKSQAGEGWRILDTHYDDGGYSGGTMERPALTRMLADIEAGRIDIVVVYKIDRLTRSLGDFARMVEVFDRRGVSFVSVTQAFNTTTSMGRLTLNVLLSFAQFEREVTGERIRDKISASKAKGMWMGGSLPLGYDLPINGSRALVVNQAEAETVRLVFAAYLKLGSVHVLQRQLAERAILSKCYTTAKGRVLGGKPFSRGALFYLLRNRLYRGMIVHKGIAHPGMHDAVVDAATFDAVQARLDANTRRRATQRDRNAKAALTGRIFDADGHPMSPTGSYGSQGKFYRYYVSAPLQQGHKIDTGDGTLPRISASRLEAHLFTILRRILAGKHQDPLSLLTRVEVHRDTLHLLLPIGHLIAVEQRLIEGERAAADAADPSQLRLVTPMTVGGGRGRTWISGGATESARPDSVLIRALRIAHSLVEFDALGLPVLAAAPASAHLRKLVRLAFLAPHLQCAILAGRQPPSMRLEQLLADSLPPCWREQASRFAFNRSAGA